MRRNFVWWLAAVLMIAVRPAVGADVSYSRDIQPLLAENCFQCHGPDAAAREAELRLDVRDSAIAERDDAAAIVPGDADASTLIQRVSSGDADLRMPPADTGKRLTAEQIGLLRQWIAAGAPFERHWAFESVQRPELPQVARVDWAGSPIDRFVMAKLEESGLAPSPEADRLTLVRRLYLDLLGLLPSVAEADAFAADERHDAYERLVDRLLASPRFGERWGRHWLDQARYADSHGYTNDNERIMWPYRDWVIDAINRDLPFDRFTVEQLAGDLLPQASTDQKIATGFHRNTLINTEGGTKADQFRDEQVKDRVDTTGGVWLGLTIGCAKCHDHKYDPISQDEYYKLYAFFNSTADNNSVPPTMPAPTAAQQARLKALDAREDELQAVVKDDQGRAARQRAWESTLLARNQKQAADDDGKAPAMPWTVLELDGKSNDGAKFTALDDQSLLVSGNNTVADFYELTASSPLTKIRSVRLEVFTHDDLPKNGPGRTDNGNFVLAEYWFRTGDGRELRFTKAKADHSQPKFDVAGAIDSNPETGWAINGAPEGGPNHNRTAWFVLPATLEVEEGHPLTFKLQHHEGERPYNIGRLRISVSEEEWIDAPTQTELAKLLAVPTDHRSQTQQQRIDDMFLRQDQVLGPIFAELQTIAKDRDKLSSQVASVMVMRELGKPRPTHVQRRGDFLQPADAVQPDVPAILPRLPSADSPRPRLDFAKWLVRRDNPLTPRVRVNRVWMRLFGRGLVKTENDFGTQGTRPTHPALLDWLAAEHLHQGWSTKQLVRAIVTSATYRQQSHAPQSSAAIDPENQLLWRQNRVRVEGEIVRDLALSAGGLLSGKIGGPSVYPPQPDGVYAFTQHVKNWRTSPGEDRYRRGLYTFFYRSAPYPMLTAFDAPKFNQLCTRRDRSNTPLQSLTVANDPAMFETAQALARRTLSEGDARQTPTAQLSSLFRTCMIRPPTEAEQNQLDKFYQQQHDHFRSQPQAAQHVAPGDWPNAISTAEAAAYVAAARVVLNLDEFITRE